MFFELRQYEIKPGCQAAWITLMEQEIIPFQSSKGMVVIGSFVGETDESVYVWIRRFESEEERTALYAAVYESEKWKEDLSPKVGALMNREAIQVTRIVATPKSVLQ